MYLYLVQHGDALSKEEDATRSLSEQGIEDVRKVASRAEGLHISVRQILHSGKMRAFQTAQVLEEAVSSEMGMMETDGLSPMDDSGIWHQRLSHTHESVMLVGHLPHLAKLCSMLLCGNGDKPVVAFETAGIVCLKRIDDGSWMVDWVIKPRLIT
jgi:phosphohistidine phosphatase